MNSFQDMIKAGIAPARTQTYISETPTYDQLVRHYNMYWGAVTDTHMTDVAGCYIITGHRVTRKHIFDELLRADHWEDLKFPTSFAYLMMKKNLCGMYTTINGQTAYIISQWDGEGKNPVFIDKDYSGYVPQTARRFVTGLPEDNI